MFPLIIQTLTEHSQDVMNFQWWLIAGLISMLGILVGYVHSSNVTKLKGLQEGQATIKKSIEDLKDNVNEDLKDIDRRVSRIEGRLGLSNGRKVEP